MTPADVEFPNDPATASPNRVKVTVSTAARAQADGRRAGVDAHRRYFGTSTVDIARHRNGRGCARQRDDVRQAVHDS